MRARIAYRELVRWMSADYGFDEIDAYMLLSQAGTQSGSEIYGRPRNIRLGASSILKKIPCLRNTWPKLKSALDFKKLSGFHDVIGNH